MAGGGFGDDKGGARAHLYEYRITGYFVFACVVAAMGGSLFGYDLGVSGEYIYFLLKHPIFLISNTFSLCFYKCLVWKIYLGLFKPLVPLFSSNHYCHQRQFPVFFVFFVLSPFPLNSEEELVVDQRKVWGKNIHKQKWVKKKDKVIFSYNNMR